jgi:hypothetical protein
MSDYVRPSPKNSVSALPPTLAKGMTAMDSICVVPALPRQYQIPAATIATNKTATATTQYLRAEACWVAAGNTAPDFPDPVSLLRAFTSAAAEAGPEIADAGGIIAGLAVLADLLVLTPRG